MYVAQSTSQNLSLTMTNETADLYLIELIIFSKYSMRFLTLLCLFFTGDLSGDLFRCRVPCPAVERRLSFEVPRDVGSPEVHPEAHLHHRPDSGLGLNCCPGVGVKWSGLRYLSHSRHSLLTDTQNASR